MAEQPGTGLELLTPFEMGQLDQSASRLVDPLSLMEAAGRAVARAIVRDSSPCRVLVLAGPGNNGGDGAVVARLLAARGWPVRLAVLAPAASGTDAAQVLARWRGLVVPFDRAEAARADLVVDAVFGAGLSRPLPDAVASVLAGSRRVVAIDVPSGVDGATGEARGPVTAAAMTVTFVRLKPGHLLSPGRELCGRVVLAPIGMPATLLDEVAASATLWRNEPPLWRLRQPGASDHKYSRGTVSVIGGAGMGGAALLAANAARRAGAGLVRLAALWGAAPFRGCAPGLIVDEGPLAGMLADERRQVWVCGPGLSADEAAGCLPALLAARRTVVVDGGALSTPALVRGAAVLTPHAGEFDRMFGAPGADRLAAARAAARLTGAVVVMKGSATIVAAPDGRATINVHATPALATAGTGDTLAGIVGAMLANGLAPFEAGSAAAWLHGEAGRSAGFGLIAEDLADRLPAALRKASSLC